MKTEHTQAPGNQHKGQGLSKNCPQGDDKGLDSDFLKGAPKFAYQISIRKVGFKHLAQNHQDFYPSQRAERVIPQKIRASQEKI